MSKRSTQMRQVSQLAGLHSKTLLSEGSIADENLAVVLIITGRSCFGVNLDRVFLQVMSRRLVELHTYVTDKLRELILIVKLLVSQRTHVLRASKIHN